MIKIEKLTKSFNGRKVLCNLSCQIASTDLIAIMGPNGTGKSTFFDAISGKTLPDAGLIEIEGRDCTFLPEQKRAHLVGRLFQNTYLGSCASLSIRENLALASLKGKKAGMQAGVRAFPEYVVEEFIKPLGLNLETMLDVPMGALSGGQRQFISFIMAVLHPPKLLLLDEPTAALDPNSATLLLTFARQFAQEHRIPILLITHDPLIARHWGNKLWVLEEGAIQKQFGEEKRALDPSDFFHHINYDALEMPD